MCGFWELWAQIRWRVSPGHVETSFITPSHQCKCRTGFEATSQTWRFDHVGGDFEGVRAGQGHLWDVVLQLALHLTWQLAVTGDVSTCPGGTLYHICAYNS